MTNHRTKNSILHFGSAPFLVALLMGLFCFLNQNRLANPSLNLSRSVAVWPANSPSVPRPAAFSMLMAHMCPFCDAIKGTMSENMVSSDISVYAEAIEGNDAKPGAPQPVSFQILKVINRRDSKLLEKIKPKTIVSTNTDLNFKKSQKFLIFGTLEFQLSWQSPVMVTDEAITYLDEMSKLPKDGPKRIEVAYRFLENKDNLIADDAYNEFAKASYQSVLDIKDHYNRKQILGWIADENVSNNRKRLYFTLLGICGTPEEIPFLKKLILKREKNSVIGLDAIIACYLTLSGKDGLKLVENEFLSNPNMEYAELFAAVAALRFHASEGKTISKKDVIASVRKLLDRPKFADLIIPDLARWKDWESAEKLMTLFDSANEETKWVRRSVVQFLLACPKEIGEKHLSKLRKSHPKIVDTTERLFALQSQIDDAANSDDEFDSQLDAIERARRQSRTKKDDDDEEEILESESDIFGDTKKDQKKSEKKKKKDSKGSAPDLQLEPILPGENQQLVSTSLPAPTGIKKTRVSVRRPDFEAGETGKGLPKSKPKDSSDKLSETNSKTSEKTASTAGSPSAAVTPADFVQPKKPDPNTLFAAKYRWWFLGGPIVANILLFALAWSILCGWFNRLFF